MMEKRRSSSPSKPNKAADPRTLFVKFHPPSAAITRQHLSDHFSNYGPVNRCSVIRQSKSNVSAAASDSIVVDRGSKGYGFVRFVNEDDAKSAADAIYKKTKGKQNSGGEVMIVDGIQYKVHAERAVDAATAAASAPKNSTPKKERATAAASKNSPQPPSATKDTPVITPISKENELQAEAKRKRTSRVIIRNLSFYANEKHIKSAMEADFGPVAAVDLPLVPDLPNKNKDEKTNDAKFKKNVVPRHRGFAFVTFTNANAAKQAVERGSEITIKNRKVAIDFSVSKLEHQKMVKDKKNEEKKEEDTESESSDGSGSDSDSENEEKDSEGSGDSDSEDDGSGSSDEEDDDSESEGEDEDEEEESSEKTKNNDSKDGNTAKEAPEFDESEAKRTLFLRNIPFDAKRHDVFELFRKFGRIEAVYLVKDRQTGVFKGTAFVRFEKVDGSAAAMEAAGASDEQNEQFVSSKNMAMGLGEGGELTGLTLKGRHILVDLAVDRTTASSLAVQRDEDGKPIKKMVGKDRRNLYLKNEGRVSSAADNAIAADAGALHGGTWEDLPPGDRAKRERAFADKSTKLRSPLFFINPTRISIRNLSKTINEADLKQLVFGALKKGVEQQLAMPADAVAHWRAGGEMPHSEVMKRATDPTLVIPPLDEKNVREVIPSVYIDRDVVAGKKTADAPSKGFGFVEFTHHTHALAVLRLLNNNPAYSAEYAAGGQHAAGMKGGKKSKKTKADPETGAEFLGEDGKVCVPRLIVEFTAENKVKARQQAEKIAQKKANTIKQRIEKKVEKKEKKQRTSDEKKDKKKGRGALQRDKKRARKEAGEDDDNEQNNEGKDSTSKKQKLDDKSNTADKPEKKTKTVKPQKKRKVDKDEDALEDMIRSYKSTFSKGAAAGKALAEESNDASEPKKESKEKVVTKRWFE